MKYIFTEEQFITLLALAGEKKLYLFCQEEIISDASLVNAIAGLYQRNRVTESKGRLVPSKSLMEMIQAMSQSEYIVKFTFLDRNFSQHLVYMARGREVLVLEKQQTRNRPVMKLWKTEDSYYIHDLFENDMLPEDLIEDRSEAEELEEMALKDLPAEYGEESLLLRVERIRACDGETDNTVDVFQSAAFKWIHVSEGPGGYYHVYSTEELGNLLLSEIRGQQYD